MQKLTFYIPEGCLSCPKSHFINFRFPILLRPDDIFQFDTLQGQAPFYLTYRFTDRDIPPCRFINKNLLFIYILRQSR